MSSSTGNPFGCPDPNFQPVSYGQIHTPFQPGSLNGVELAEMEEHDYQRSMELLAGLDWTKEEMIDADHAAQIMSVRMSDFISWSILVMVRSILGQQSQGLHSTV